MSNKLIAVLLCLALLLFPSLALALPYPATVSTFAGQGIWGEQDGAKEEAQFRLPTYATIDGEGNIYVADTQNHLIRQIDPTGQVTTLAGRTSGTDDYGLPLGGYQDGKFAEAMFNEPRGIVVAGDGTIYVADSQNGAIRVLATDGTVSTLLDGLAFPSGLALADNGELYVSETLAHRILSISPDGTYTVLAGGGYVEEDGWPIGGLRDGVAGQAQFNEPTGLALAQDGTLYIADTGNQRIRALSQDGVVTTIAGSGAERIAETGYIIGGYQDGLATEAQFNYPSGLALGEDGTVYVADTLNHRIRAIRTTGEVDTLLGVTSYGHENGIEVKASFDHPIDLVGLANGDLLIVDQWNHALRLAEWYQLPADLKVDGNIHLVWNQTIVETDTQPENKHGRIMVPVRALAEAFGYAVEWDEALRQVSFSDGEQEIRMQIGSTEVSGDVELTMDVAPYIKDNRTLVPVRFVAEAFDKHVDWLASSRTVLIRD